MLLRLGKDHHFSPFTYPFCADLKKFLKKNADGKTLGVADAKLGSLIKEKLGIPCIYRWGGAFQKGMHGQNVAL